MQAEAKYRNQATHTHTRTRNAKSNENATKCIINYDLHAVM